MKEARMNTKPKQIVYRYNGDAASEEVVQDLSGEITIPEKDSTVIRNGREWKAVHVTTEVSVTDPKALPIHRVFLTSAR
jgi:hypothetical protein